MVEINRQWIDDLIKESNELDSRMMDSVNTPSLKTDFAVKTKCLDIIMKIKELQLKGYFINTLKN